MAKMDEDEIILAVMDQVVDRMARLSREGRQTLLCALLAQEICQLPPDERTQELLAIMREMPDMLVATEQGMREALVQNAKGEG